MASLIESMILKITHPYYSVVEAHHDKIFSLPYFCKKFYYTVVKFQTMKVELNYANIDFGATCHLQLRGFAAAAAMYSTHIIFLNLHSTYSKKIDYDGHCSYSRVL